MLKLTEIKRYCTDTRSGCSDFRIEPEQDTFIASNYAISSGALRCWILDHLQIQLQDNVFKTLVYQNVVKIFSGKESDWHRTNAVSSWGLARTIVD